MLEKDVRNVSQVRADYDKAANSYDLYRFGTEGGRYTDQLEKALLRRFLRKGTVLEVGVATGRFALFLDRLGFDYTGIDVSPGMLQVALAKARVQGRQFSAVLMDAHHMYFRGSFDNVICLRTFHFLPDPVECLRRMSSSVNGCGRCVVTFETDNLLRRVLLRMGLGNSKQRYYKSDEVEKMFHNVGLRVISSGFVLRLPATFYRRCPTALLPLLRRVDPIWPWPVQGYVLGEHQNGQFPGVKEPGRNFKEKTIEQVRLPSSLTIRARSILFDNPIFQRAVNILFNSYRRRWNLASLTETGAMDAILTGVTNDREFEEKGIRDASTLKELLGPDSVVLDLGCGIGRVDKYLSPWCKRLCAVDVSDRMLAFARKRLAGISNVELYRNNGRDLSGFPDKTFDLAFALIVFHHLDKNDARTYLEEIFRVLKNDGTAYLQFPNRFSPPFSKKKIERRRHDVARTRWYSESEVRTLVGAVGFNATTTTFERSDIIGVCKK